MPGVLHGRRTPQRLRRFYESSQTFRQIGHILLYIICGEMKEKICDFLFHFTTNYV